MTFTAEKLGTWVLERANKAYLIEYERSSGFQRAQGPYRNCDCGSHKNSNTATHTGQTTSLCFVPSDPTVYVL